MSTKETKETIRVTVDVDIRWRTKRDRLEVIREIRNGIYLQISSAGQLNYHIQSKKISIPRKYL